MKNNIKLKILISISTSLLLFGCYPKNSNIDFDFATLKKSNKNTIIGKKNKNNINIENNIKIKDLVPLKNKQEILSKTKFGKKDPFSEGEIQSNKFNSDLKITGFLNTEINKYVFVNYLGNEGTITEGSIGGNNTNLLPDGAKVLKIDSENIKLIIDFENKKYIFEM